jgi:hypothetical protein
VVKNKLLLGCALLLTILSFISIAGVANAAVFTTNGSDKGAFVRALAPNLNYGGGGALSVSGTNATTGNPTNGAFDTFISFNTAAMVSNFNSIFGPSNWVITSATINLTANLAPGNAVFNYGTGSFQIRWIANDTWIAGTGTPNAPTTNGITYSQESSYLNTNTDMNLGAFTFAGSAKLSCPLALPNAFVTNMQAGGEVGFFMTAIDPGLGYVFYSRNYAGNTNSLPYLVVSATAQPGISGISLSGTNLVLTATNGVAGGTYYVLTSTNLAAPIQWTAILTNVLAASGNFAVTVTNAANSNAPSAQFFILETQ